MVLVKLLGLIVENADLWIERFAELLGCDERPGAVAAAIEQLKDEVDRARKAVPKVRKEASQQARDQTIRSMRRAAVNCGQNSRCYVANHFFRTSDEEG